MSGELHSDNPIIVFDGVCVLCSRWMQFIIKHDKRRQFMFASMQSDVGQLLMSNHGLDPRDPLSLLLVDESGGHVDSDAIIRVLSRLGGVWKAAIFAKVIPTSLRDVAYRLLARNRYRWFGKRETCMMPEAKIIDRFIK